jgi:hypothetical protein
MRARMHAQIHTHTHTHEREREGGGERRGETQEVSKATFEAGPLRDLCPMKTCIQRLSPFNYVNRLSGTEGAECLVSCPLETYMDTGVVRGLQMLLPICNKLHSYNPRAVHCCARPADANPPFPKYHAKLPLFKPKGSFITYRYIFMRAINMYIP